MRLLPRRLKFRAYDDMGHTLRELQRSGIQMIVVSNVSSRRNLQVYLNKAGSAILKFLIASGSVRCEKPKPEIFRIASILSRIPVERMVHVGDKYEEDYLRAELAWIKAILLDRKGVYGDKRCAKVSKLTGILTLF